jgi:hypothetical protein
VPEQEDMLRMATQPWAWAEEGASRIVAASRAMPETHLNWCKRVVIRVILGLGVIKYRWLILISLGLSFGKIGLLTGVLPWNTTKNARGEPGVFCC